MSRPTTSEERFDEIGVIFQALAECCRQKKICATNDGKPLLPELWKFAKELVEE